MEHLYSASHTPIPHQGSRSILERGPERLQESERVAICEKCLLDLKVQLHTWTHSWELWLHAQDLYKIKPAKSQYKWERGSRVPQLSDELLATDGCWRSEGQFFFRDVYPQRLPMFGTTWSYTHAHTDSPKLTQWALKERHKPRERGEREGVSVTRDTRKEWWEELEGKKCDHGFDPSISYTCINIK